MFYELDYFITIIRLYNRQWFFYFYFSNILNAESLQKYILFYTVVITEEAS